VTTLQPSRFRVAGDPHTVLRTRPQLTHAVAQLLAERLDAACGAVVDLRRAKV